MSGTHEAGSTILAEREDHRGRRGERGGSSLGWLVMLVVAAVGAFGLWWASLGEESGGVDADLMVQVEQRELIDAVSASGRVEPRTRVAVMSRAGGILKEIHVEEGDHVTVGQVLAELDREQIEAQLAEDKADLASARARVLAAKARLVETRVGLQDPELTFAQREADRLQPLFDAGDVSRRERDDAFLRLETVKFRIEMVAASIPVLEASVAEAEANLESAQAALERSETTLREATIRCPIDGVVLVREKEVGDGVSSILTAGGNATSIMSLGDLTGMFIEARVDEVDLGRIHVGMPAIITVDAHRGERLQGEIARIAPAGSVDDNGIVTFEVRVTVADPRGLLRPDMTADAKLVLDRREGALALPARAISRSPDGKWIVQRVTGDGSDATASRVEVEVGLSDGLMTEIVSGLQEGDRVLVGGAGGPPRGPR